jgi:hypothetical protein
MALVTMIDGARAGALHLVTTLGQASLEAAVVGLAVWGVCRLLPGLPAHVRAWLWCPCPASVYHCSPRQPR